MKFEITSWRSNWSRAFMTTICSWAKPSTTSNTLIEFPHHHPDCLLPAETFNLQFCLMNNLIKWVSSLAQAALPCLHIVVIHTQRFPYFYQLFLSLSTCLLVRLFTLHIVKQEISLCSLALPTVCTPPPDLSFRCSWTWLTPSSPKSSGYFL